MASMLAAMRKSFRAPSVKDNVKKLQDPSSDIATKRAALWNIRDQAEKRNNLQELISEGAIPEMVKALSSENSEERLWALWVIRFCSSTEIGTTMVLQEPNAIEGLVKCIMESNVGSEAAKRAVQAVSGLSAYTSTQILLCRDDVFKALAAALLAALPEATASVGVLYSLAEIGQPAPPYLSGMKRLVYANLVTVKEGGKLRPAELEKCEKLIAALDEVGGDASAGAKATEAITEEE